MRQSEKISMPRLRGDELDQKIDQALVEMLAEGLLASPISRSAVQKRLNLKSRSTLIGERASRIADAQRKQLQAAGLSANQKRRATLKERIEKQQVEIAELRATKDRYFKSLTEIIHLMQSKGWPVEQHLKALRASSEDAEPRS